MVNYSFKNLLDFACILEEAGKRGVSVRQVVLGPSDKGAEVIKERLLEESKGKRRLKFIWTQSECDTVDRTANTDTVATTTASTAATASVSVPVAALKKTTSPFIKPIRKKNLTKIYDTFPQDYTPANTLIIDDSTDKLVDHSCNHLRIEEFRVTDAEVDFTEDQTLLQVKKYLERLLKEDPTDLRTFLAKYDLSDF